MISNDEQLKKMDNYQLFPISEDGNAFVKLQIKKSITFFIIGTIILAVISLSTLLNKDGLDNDRLPLGVGVFCCLFSFHLWTWLRGITIRNRIIMELQVTHDVVIITVFFALSNTERKYLFNLEDCYLDKGVDFSTDKSTNLFELEHTYKLVVRRPDIKYFYFITSFWPAWPEIKALFNYEED